MNLTRRIAFCFALILTIARSGAQNMTGTWEGLMSQEQLQVNIQQEDSKEICGYTYDYFRDNRKDHCKAYFKGIYNPKQDCWELTGISFLENSGNHVLMRIKLYKDMREGEPVLLAMVSDKASLGFLMNMGIRENAVLRRVSRKPTPLGQNLPICFPEPEKPFTKPAERPKPAVDSPARKPALPVQPVDTLTRIKRDSLIIQPEKPVVRPVPKRDTLQLNPVVKARKNVTFSRIPVTVKQINLKVYDNAVVDGDTVSIYYNGKLLVNRQRLTEKPIEINLELDEQAKQHEILLFAHNLGSIPPNTALIVVTAGDKRYELHSSASLTENALLVFEYVPK